MSEGKKHEGEERMFTEAELAALTKDGLTQPLADALDTITAALRRSVATEQAASPHSDQRRPLTIHSKSRGLHLTLVINARRDDGADAKE